MKVKAHIALSLGVSSALGLAFNSWAMALGSLLTGVLTDLDHVSDYLIERGVRLSAREFFAHFYEQRHKRIILVLHGWEWVIALGAVAWATRWAPWSVGALMGYAHHIVSDALSNGLKPRAYSFLWRMSHGFKSGVCFAGDKKRSVNDVL